MTKNTLPFLFIALSLLLQACQGGKMPDTKSDQQRRQERFGRLFGDELLTFGKKVDPQDEINNTNNNYTGVNSILWSASMDAVSFMPLIQADRISGTILSDWYQDPKNPQERFKIDIKITSSALRSDGFSVNLFRQEKKDGLWEYKQVDPDDVDEIERSILNKARKLRIKSEG